MNERDQPNAPIYTILPYLHPAISPNDLDDKGMLINRGQVYTVADKKYASYSKLGAGLFGTVYLAQETSSGEWVALKVLLVSSEKATLEYEFIEKVGRGRGKEAEQVLVMSFLPGKELFEFTENLQTIGKKLNDVELLQIAIGMCDSINDLNVKFDILLRDIKAENFIYHSATGKVIATDYGLAIKAGTDENLTVHDTKVVGNLFTIAPESRTKAIYSKCSEAFATGRAIADSFNLLDDNLDQLLTENSRKFNDLKEMRITDPNLRREILHVLVQMTHFHPGHRLLLDEAAKQFRQIQKKYIQNKKRDLDVCVLDLAEFSTLAGHKKDKLFANLENFDRILFIHSDSVLSQHAFLKLKLAVDRGLKEVGSLARVSSTVASGLPHDELVNKACMRMQLESRRGAYHFKFNETKGDDIIKLTIPSTDLSHHRTEQHVAAAHHKLDKKHLSGHMHSNFLHKAVPEEKGKTKGNTSRPTKK